MEDKDLQNSVTLEMLRHDKYIIKWLLAITTFCVIGILSVLAGAGYIFYYSDIGIDKFGNITNSTDISNSNTVETLNNYNNIVK